MDASKLETFLDLILVDSVGQGTNIPERPGYVYWELDDGFLKHQDFHVLAWDETGKNPFQLDGDSNHTASICAMSALLQLRKYWKDGYIEDNYGVEEALDSMSGDVQAVISLLTEFRSKLLLLKTGEVGLQSLVKKAEAEASVASSTGWTAKQKEILTATAAAKASYTLDLYKILTEGPVEELARVSLPPEPKLSPLGKELLELLAEPGNTHTNKTEATS